MSGTGVYGALGCTVRVNSSMYFVLGAFQCTVLCILVHREMFFWSPFHEAFRCGLSGHIAMESGQPVFRCLSFSVLDAKSATANDLDKSLLDKFIHIVGCSPGAAMPACCLFSTGQVQPSVIHPIISACQFHIGRNRAARQCLPRV